MKDTYNFRNPAPGEIQEMRAEVQRRRIARAKYRLLHQLLSGETVDLRNSPELFEALNREKMEFDQILKLHPDQAKSAIVLVRQARNQMAEGKYWNSKSKAKWGYLGEIPTCLYYARPIEYWKDRKIVRQFFNMYPKFRVSSKPI